MKNNLRELRKRGGWSQAEIGKRLDMAHNSVSGYESGKTPLDKEMIASFAKALEVDVEEIEVSDGLHEDEVPYQASPALEALSEAELVDLITRFAKESIDAEIEAERRKKIYRAMAELSAELQRREPVKSPRVTEAAVKAGQLAADRERGKRS